MKCKYCGKNITESTSTFHKGEDYYCNELCYIHTLDKIYNKKVNELLQYYFTNNDKTIEMPKQYFIMFNRLKKEVTEPRYALYFLYNSRNQIENINRRFSLGKENTRMYKIWEYIKNNYYILLPEYYKKSEGIIHTYENQNTKGKSPRRKNKLLEE